MANLFKQMPLAGSPIDGVTVVIPFLNRSKYFVRLLESLNLQTFKPSTVLVVDNGSYLNEIEFIWRHINTNYPFQISIVSTLHTGNANIARNLGLILANTEYVAFLDSDDYWSQDHLETCITIARGCSDVGMNDVAIYCSSKIIYKDSSSIIFSRQIKAKENVYNFLLGVGHGFAQSSGLFISKNLSHDVLWDEDLPRMQDIDFFISISSKVNWIFSSKTTVMIDWEENKYKNINFDGFIKFYLKHERKMPLAVKTRYLLFSLKECVVRSGNDEVFQFFKQNFAELSFIHKLFSVLIIYRKPVLVLEKAISRIKKVNE